MVRIREDIVHVSVRHFLRNAGWQLVAGQYPNGSDDELPALSIMDPTLARDNSPDPRRHSKNKYVPDLIAYDREYLLIIEMKSTYSLKDELKLTTILSERREDLLAALVNLAYIRNLIFHTPIHHLTFVPCLGFGGSVPNQRNFDFCYFLVDNPLIVTFVGNAVVPAITLP